MKIAIKIIVSLILLAVLLNFGDSDKLIVGFRQLSWFSLSFALVLLPFNIAVQWWKWHFLVGLVENKASRRETLVSTLIGLLFGLITPARAGELGRAFYISSDNRGQLVALTFLDKIYSQAALLFLGLPASLFLITRFTKFSAMTGSAVILGMFASISIVALVIFPGKIAVIFAGINRRFFKSSRIDEALTGLISFGLSKSLLLFSMSLIFVLIYLTQFMFVIESFATGDRQIMFAALALIMTINLVLPIFFGNLGIREFSSVVLLPLAGISKEAAFNSSILLFVINLLLPALLGYIFFLKHKDEKLL